MISSRQDANPIVAEQKLSCCFSWSECIQCIEHNKHHWKQSGLYISIHFVLLDTSVGTRPLEPFLLRTRLIIAALLATFFLCLSSSINPIIYNFTNGEFRREFRKCSVFAVKEQELCQGGRCGCWQRFRGMGSQSGCLINASITTMHLKDHPDQTNYSSHTRGKKWISIFKKKQSANNMSSYVHRG